MRLSEAIRLGSMVGPQLRGETFNDGDGSCAMGSALKAIGQVHRPYTAAFDFFPLSMHFVDGPAGLNLLVLTHVRWMNDHAGWTREQIATWVESIERTDEAQSPEAGEARSPASDSTVSDAEVLISVSI